jgi:VCBS repeat-containing protein
MSNSHFNSRLWPRMLLTLVMLVALVPGFVTPPGDVAANRYNRAEQMSSLAAASSDISKMVMAASPTLTETASIVTVDEGQTATNSGTYSHPGPAPLAVSASVGTVTQTQTSTTSLNVLGYWQLGEDDAGAANGVAGNSTTLGRDANGLTSTLNLTRSGSPAYTSPDSPASVIFDSFDGSAASNNPSIYPVFTTTASLVINRILNWHQNAAFNGGQDPTTVSGTISILNYPSGTSIGAWSAAPSGGSNLGWEVLPNITLPPGSYTIVESQTGTSSWSYTTGGSSPGPDWKPNQGMSSVNATPITPNNGSVLAMAFNGSTDGYVRNSPVTAVTDNFGIEAWVRFDSVSGGQTIVYNGNSSTSGFGLIVNGGTYQGLYGGIVGFDTGVAATPNVWYDVALVRNNGVSQIYLDGALIYSNTISNPNPATTAFAIGRSPEAAAAYLDGSVDDARVFTFSPGTFAPQDLLINTSVSGDWSWAFKTDDGPAQSQGVTITASTGASGDTSSLPFSLVVNNVAPVAVNDAYNTTEDTPLTVTAPGVLVNDTDVVSDTLTAIKVSDPLSGTLTLNADGSFTYTPSLWYAGSDSFTYKANDGLADSDVATVTITVAVRTGCTPQPTNLVSWWRAEGNAQDFLGSNNGSLVNGATFTTTGQVGQAFSFNGASQYVTVPSSTTLEMRNNLTVLAWFKVNSLSGNAKVFSKRPSTWGPFEINLTNTGTKIVASSQGSTTGSNWNVGIASSQSISLGTWYQVAFVIDGSNLHSFYLNGQSQGTQQLASQLMSHAGTPFLLGISTGGFPLNGAVDEVMIFNRALSAAEIERIYNAASVSGVCTPPNTAPVAEDNTYTTTEDMPLTIGPSAGVLTNDIDMDTNPLTAVQVSNPTHGALAFNADGSFVYTPTADYNGSDNFTYTATDTVLASNVATVSLTVTAVNDAPVAANDSYSTDEDTVLTITASGVLTNDIDMDTNPLTAVQVSDPAHGALAFNADGSFVYTPTANYNGSDNFTYTATDTVLASNVATVTITVTAVNDAPVAVNDSYTTTEDTPLTVIVLSVLGNDTDVEANPLTAVKVTGPTHGALTLSASGSFTYTPTANYNGSDGFTYQANDGAANSNVATVSLTVTAVNDAPVAVNDSYTTTEDTPLTVAPSSGVLSNDTDVEGDPLTAVKVTGPAHGALALNIDGTFTYTPTANYNGGDGFTYQANDGTADSNVATVTITVTAVNDAPVAVNDAYTATEDTPLTVTVLSVLGNDTDVEANPLTAVKVTGPTHGALTLNVNGSFTYTPTANYNGSDSFTYQANDGVADSNVATVSLTVTAVNDAPVAVNDIYTATEDTPLTITAPGVLVNDTDVDGDFFWMKWYYPASHGDLTFYDDGSFVYTPASDFAGTDTFTYQATDGVENSNWATVTITVTAVNDAPVAVNDTYTATEDTPLTVTALGVLINDTDVEGDLLTAVKVSDPAHGVVTLNANGSFTYTPTANYNGSDSFTYQANDGAANSNVATVSLTVTPVNDAPVAVHDNYTTDYETALTVAPSAGVLGNDTNVDGDTLTAIKVSDPVHGELTLNADGSFTYTPTVSYSGSDSFTYRANDGVVDSNVATVDITVLPPVGDTGLLGYWKFDEGSGTTAADSSDYHNNGTLSGGAAFTTTAAPITYYADPGSLRVSSVTTGVVTVTNSAVNRLTNNFTAMGWIRPNSVSGYQRVIATARTKSNNGWSMGLWYGTLLFSTNGKKDYYSSSSSSGLKAGQWYHVAAVMDSSNAVTFYLDGVLVGTIAGASPAVADTDDVLQIGGSTASGGSALIDPFNGLIDDLRVYDHAMTASDIADLVGVPPCSEPVFRARVLLGEISASKTITLDGACTYPLTYADNALNGGSGVYLFTATTLEGNGATIERSAAAPTFRLLTVNPAITIRNLTLRGGNVPYNGAGLLAFSNITLTNVYFGNNTATNPSTTTVSSGGALYVTGNLTVDRSFFVGNQAGGRAGAIWFTGLNGRVTNSVFADNLSGGSGAALNASNVSGTLTLLNNTFADQYKNGYEALLLNGTATAQNNIFYNYKAGLTASGSVTVTEDYNLFAANDLDPQALNGAIINRGGHSRIAALPRFVNPVARNYRLQANSPAIDLGVDAGVPTDADGNPRPYGTAADIGAYEYQGVGIPSVSISKAGPPYVSPESQFRFVLTVINEGASSLNDLRVVEQLPVGATYVTGTATYSGTFNNGTLTWDLSPLDPNQSKRVEYKVTAIQNLVSNNYSVTSILSPTITASGPAITTTYDVSTTAMGFFSYPDGYNFPNTGAAQDSDFNTDDIVYTFGAGNVCKVTSPACVLNASAEAYRQKVASPNGGHCFGMAMSSLWLYDRLDVTPGDYQSGAAITFELAKSNAWKLIQRFHWTQGQMPVSTTIPARTVTTGAANVVNTLKANFANPAAGDRYELSLFKMDGTGGHAVVPYAVKQIDADNYWIYAYDNNYPNNFDRVFKVTMSTNSWIYEGGATSPGAPVSAYTGDDTVPGHIGLQSLRYNESFPKKCTTSNACAPITTTLQMSTQNLQTASSAYDFQLEGEGYLMITRSDGKRVGVDPTGRFIAEIPGAEQVDYMTGLGLNIPNTLHVPHTAGMTYKLSISNRPNAYGNQVATADVFISGEGYLTRLKGLKIDSPADPQAAPGTNDIVGVTFDGDKHQVIYQSSALDSDTPSLGMAISQANGPDFTFEVDGAQVSSGHSLLAAFDVATGKLTIENNDPSNNTYALDVERINLDGSKTAYHSDAVSDGTSVGAIVDLGSSWTGGAPTITPNNTPSLFHLYLPLVAR